MHGLIAYLVVGDDTTPKHIVLYKDIGNIYMIVGNNNSG